ncbi:MAG TPA: glycosyltransferase family 4 protein [Solirubrobacteraceae bacterium]
MSAPRTVILGAFPPPVGGAAKNNAILHQSLRDAGVEAVKLDTSASTVSHKRSLRFHAERIRGNTTALVGARRAARPDATLYFVPNAGSGLWYTLAQVKAVGARYARLVCHHRSFRYIDELVGPMQRLTQAFPEKTTHVFLSPGQADGFRARYGEVTHLVASNARYVCDEAAAPVVPRAPGPLRLGHLSNLCREKGFFDVADAYEALRREGADAELHVAGPVVEPEVEPRLAALRAAYGDAVRTHGPLAGAEKRDFYRGLDVFLFPTRFEQEAAPNVGYESLAAGVPVLAFDRGCLPEMVSGESGAVCDRHGDFTAFVLERLAGFSIDDDDRGRRATAIKASMVEECTRSQAQHRALMELLGARDAAVVQEF